MILLNEFKPTCSGLGQILTEPRSKADTVAGLHLSKTCLEYVFSWIKMQPEFYGRRSQLNSKYLEKGTYCEPASIVFAAKYYKWIDAKKNEIRLSNDFLEGECDVDLEYLDLIVDIKNSWDESTFPLFKKEIPTIGYDWQLHGYMWLYGRKFASLIYTLMDAPDYMIEREARKHAFALGLDELDDELYQHFKQKMTFSNFADNLRIKRFDMVYEEWKTQHIIQRVYEIRKFIKSITFSDYIDLSNDIL